MVTQEGKNTHVVGIEGNFDDAQTGVKRIIFNDKALFCRENEPERISVLISKLN